MHALGSRFGAGFLHILSDLQANPFPCVSVMFFRITAGKIPLHVQVQQQESGVVNVLSKIF